MKKSTKRYFFFVWFELIPFISQVTTLEYYYFCVYATKSFSKVVVKSSVKSLCLFLCFLLQSLLYGQCLVFPGVISIWKKKIRGYPKSGKSEGIWGYQRHQMQVVLLKTNMIAVSATPGRQQLAIDFFFF